eukprot:790358_1
MFQIINRSTMAHVLFLLFALIYMTCSQSDKNIISFNLFASENPMLSIDIIGAIHLTTIQLVVPIGTDLTAFVPDIIITGVSVSPSDGIMQDFTTHVIYTVTAADLCTKEYVVTILPEDVVPIPNEDSNLTTTICPTGTPSQITRYPTSNPSLTPTFIPSFTPTTNPSFAPTLSTSFPSFYPSLTPTFIPSFTSTLNPSFTPTLNPSFYPSFIPTSKPSFTPTLNPSFTSTFPTPFPMSIPTSSPTRTFIDPVVSEISASEIADVNRRGKQDDIVIVMAVVGALLLTATVVSGYVYIYSRKSENKSMQDEKAVAEGVDHGDHVFYADNPVPQNASTGTQMSDIHVNVMPMPPADDMEGKPRKKSLQVVEGRTATDTTNGTTNNRNDDQMHLDWETWSNEDVVQWISSMENGKYKQYVHGFREQNVRGIDFKNVDKQDLLQFGVTDFGDRVTIYEAIQNMISDEGKSKEAAVFTRGAI